MLQINIILRYSLWLFLHSMVDGNKLLPMDSSGGITNTTVIVDKTSRDIEPCALNNQQLISRTNSLINLNTSVSDTLTSKMSQNKKKNRESCEFRLSKNVIPTHYDLLINPDLETGLFEGTATITVLVKESVDTIYFHSKSLNITDVVVLVEGDIAIPLRKFYLLEVAEHLVLEFETSLSPGVYDLIISYNGDMKNRIVGLYESSYKSSSGEVSKIATSKFEPTYARQAFPCFDEPGMKAKYTVKIVRPTKDFIALSNMDVANQEEYGKPEDGLTLVTFNESVPMSTYLACFIVCKFAYTETMIGQGEQGNDSFPLRVYAVSEDQLPKVNFSLTIGKLVTEYYIKYFNIEYPLPKLDMIGIPDFVSGAMEHWGLVTFRETSFLYDPLTTSTATKQNIARVVAHEISHMWFGNLVTMAWWNDLWLNEGFASYMQYKSLANFYPDWKMLEQFLSSNTHSVMSLDATLASHPIVVKVETPDEITAIFDSISYNKGAAVLRMLEGFVGEESFKNGVTDYLNAHKFNNTVTQNLLDKLAVYFEVGESPHNLTYIMDTWTRQMGLPVVTVAKNENGTYTLTQKRFLADPDAVVDKPSEFNYRWYIPITYTTRNGASTETVWFKDTDESVLLVPPEGEEVIKLNNDQVGYYRVNYPDDMWDMLEKELNTNDTVLSVSDKAHILNDIFSLAEAGLVSYPRALKISSYLVDEDNYVTWAVASMQFNALNRVMSNSLAYTEFQAHVRSLLSNVIDKVGWDSTDADDDVKDHIVKLTRAVVMNLACTFGEMKCLDESKKRFLDWLENGTAIHPDIKGIVYFFGIERTEDTQWMEFYNRFLKETDAQEKSRMLQSLSASRNPARLKWYLQKAWDNDVVRSQDYFSVMQYISANPVGTPIVWDYFRENWEKIRDRFTLNSRTLGTTVPYITRTFATKQKLREMEDFFAMYPEAGAGATARQQALENVQNNIKWIENNEASVSKWLTENAKS